MIIFFYKYISKLINNENESNVVIKLSPPPPSPAFRFENESMFIENDGDNRVDPGSGNFCIYIIYTLWNHKKYGSIISIYE